MNKVRNDEKTTEISLFCNSNNKKVLLTWVKMITTKTSRGLILH